jgi:hypothetical protein
MWKRSGKRFRNRRISRSFFLPLPCFFISSSPCLPLGGKNTNPDFGPKNRPGPDPREQTQFIQKNNHQKLGCIFLYQLKPKQVLFYRKLEWCM